jgi:hypothetical protein
MDVVCRGDMMRHTYKFACREYTIKLLASSGKDPAAMSVQKSPKSAEYNSFCIPPK